MLVDLYKQGAIPNLLIGNKGAVQTPDGLPKGNYAEHPRRSVDAGIWAAQYATSSRTYSPVPAGPGGSVSVVGGEDIVMTSSSKHQAGGGGVHRLHTEPTRSSWPWRRPGRCRWSRGLDAQEQQLDAVLRAVHHGARRRRSPGRPCRTRRKIDTALQDDLVPAFQGKVSVQAALDKAASDIDPLLSATK